MFKHVVDILFGIFCSRRERKRSKQETHILSTLRTWTEKRRRREKNKVKNDSKREKLVRIQQTRHTIYQKHEPLK